MARSLPSSRAARLMVAAVVVLAWLPLRAAVQAGPAATGDDRGRSRAVPGELLVGVTPRADVAGLVRAAGAASARRLPHRGDVLVLRVPGGREQATAAALLGRPGVRWAAPNHVARASAAPNDPLYRYQWNLGTRTRAGGGANWEPVNGSGITGRGVTVAVVDSGVTPNEELDQVVPGRDFVDDDDDPRDANGHGTHVAGTIAQSTGNGRGVAGVAPDATVLAVRVLDASGSGSYADILSGIALAVDRGADVVNLSLGGPADGGLCEAVASAVARGVVVVAAAGNSAGPVEYPAACPAAIAVSATTITAALASYSNSGPQVALAAPGGDTSTDLDLDGAPDGVLQYTFAGGQAGYAYYAGTSMATPHVAGTAALVLQASPGLSPAQVRSLLLSTARDIGLPGRDPQFGAGLLDIAAAVTAAGATPAEQVPPPPPVPSPTSPAPGEPAPSPDTGPTPGEVTRRVAGGDRYATAVAVSRAGFEGGARRVFLASGTSFPDALSAGALAGRLPGPVLLTEPCRLPAQVGDELARLTPSEVLVVGGESAVCTPVAAEAAARAGAPFRRISGADRYETAAALAQAGWADGASTVFLAAGTTFPDSLPGGAAAAHASGPLLLTDTCRLPDAAAREVERLRPRNVVVLGGPGAVCDPVLDAVRTRTGAAVSRVAGADRYSTAAEAARQGWSAGADVVVVASGVAFPDGLAGGALAGVLGGPLVLVPSCGVPGSVRDAVGGLAPERVIVLGGQAAICDDAVRELGAAAAGS